MRQALLVLSLLCAACAVRVSPTLKTMHSLDFIERTIAPTRWTVPGDDHAKQLERLSQWVRLKGIRLGFVPEINVDNYEDVAGLTQTLPSGVRIILIDNKPSKNSQLYTLIHEVAHTYQSLNLTRSEEHTSELQSH